jgi:hypothetical protein
MQLSRKIKAVILLCKVLFLEQNVERKYFTDYGLGWWYTTVRAFTTQATTTGIYR